jgi:hypothetical protein
MGKNADLLPSIRVKEIFSCIVEFGENSVEIKFISNPSL